MIPLQKSFGDFVKDRFGPNWVFSARDTPALHARYDKPDRPVVVITPKQQRLLKIDYHREWGRECDSEYWHMLSALREARAHLSGAALASVEDAIKAATVIAK